MDVIIIHNPINSTAPAHFLRLSLINVVKFVNLLN
jgi:hypothetical protein